MFIQLQLGFHHFLPFTAGYFASPIWLHSKKIPSPLGKGERLLQTIPVWNYKLENREEKRSWHASLYLSPTEQLPTAEKRFPAARGQLCRGCLPDLRWSVAASWPPRTATRSKGWTDPGVAAAELQATAHRERRGPGVSRPRSRTPPALGEGEGRRREPLAPHRACVQCWQSVSHSSRRARSAQCPLGTSYFPAMRGRESRGLRYLPECHSHVRALLSAAAGRCGRGWRTAGPPAAPP